MSEITATDAQAEGRGQDQLNALAAQVLKSAGKLGADSVETAVSRSQGFSATVRMGEAETVEHNRDKSLVVTVYFGQKSGSASTSDFNSGAVEDAVRAACTIARYTAADDCAGLADADRLATEIVDLDLDHPWDVSVERALEIAAECEDAARGFDARITNSEGATVSTHRGTEVYANSHGFTGATTGTRHSLSCAVVGEQDGRMQRDYWYTSARDFRELENADAVGRTAARRTVGRLGARKIRTTQCPVLYEAPVASSLLAHFISAVRGSALYRKASFLLDQIGKPVFAERVTIGEHPHLAKAVGSASYDAEGVATMTRDIAKAGILESYVLDSYSARKLGLETTGNAGGVRNLRIESGDLDFDDLIREMGTGLLITELIGAGVNNVTGDYSRGVAGYWVEGGELCYPVEEVTVAGNLKDMFRHIAAVGSDVDTRGNYRSGSILIEKVTVAGD
jgi:PmbA protein